MSAYHAFMFDSVNSDRVKVEVSIEYDRLTFKKDGERKTLYFRDMVIEKGGSNNTLFFYKSTLNPQMMIFSEDKQLFNAIKTIGGENLEFALKDLNKQASKKKVAILFLVLSLLSFICLLPVVLYFSYPMIVSSTVSVIPLEVDKKIGEVAHAQYMTNLVLVKDEKAMVALDKVLERLKPHIKEYPHEFQFFIVDNHVVNAFALPGGYIVVHTGLLLSAESAEELAGVLAHEISHVTERHSIERIISSLGIVVVANVFLGDVSGLLEMAVQGASMLGMSQFSQSQESAADTTGFLTLKDAQISPHGFTSFFERMQKQREEKMGDLKNVEELTNFFSSHPSDENRIKNIQKMFEQNPYEPIPIDLDWDEYKAELKNVLLKGEEKK